MIQRNAIFPANRHSLYEKHGYSAAIRSKDLLFVSGQVGSHQDGSPEPDHEKQVKLASENSNNTLTAAGCTVDDIIDLAIFHTDPECQLDSIMKVKSNIFNEAPYQNWASIDSPGLIFR